MRIGELANAGGVSAKTIRYYEAIGLLVAPQRTPAGYRDYDPAAAGRLAFIRAAQAIGLTLGEIRGVIALRDRGEPPCGHVLELIDARAAEIDQRIIELGRLRDELRQLIARARLLDPADCEPDRICHLIGSG